MAQPTDKSPDRGKAQRGRPKGSPHKSASFRLPQELLDQLAEAADAQDRSQTTLVRRALESFLAQQKKEAE